MNTEGKIRKERGSYRLEDGKQDDEVEGKIGYKRKGG